jgi:hypothetical protein
MSFSKFLKNSFRDTLSRKNFRVKSKKSEFSGLISQIMALCERLKATIFKLYQPENPI